MKKIGIISFIFALACTHWSYAVVSPIIPGQSLWCIGQRQGETTDTILDIVCSILDKPSSTCTGGCFATPLTAADIVFNTITISQPGNYCLTADFVADIVITASCVSLDLNQRCLEGIIVVEGANTLIFNGNVEPQAPSSNAEAQNFPGIIIFETAVHTTVQNVFVNCANSVVDGVDGRRGIISHATDTKIIDCVVHSGRGADGTLINAGNGGTAIWCEQGRLVIQDCLITTGSGGNSTAFNAGSSGVGINVGTDLADGFSLTGTIAQLSIVNNVIKVAGGGSSVNGNGGHVKSAIAIVADTITDVTISTNDVRLGNGGDGLTGGDVAFVRGFNDVNGIIFVVAQSVIANLALSENKIYSGNGGLGSFLEGGNVFSGIMVGLPCGQLSDVTVDHCELTLGNGGNARLAGGSIDGGVLVASAYDIDCGSSNSFAQRVSIHNTKVSLGNAGNSSDTSGGNIVKGAIELRNWESDFKDISIKRCDLVVGNGGDAGSFGGTINHGISIASFKDVQNVVLQDTNVTLGNAGNSSNGFGGQIVQAVLIDCDNATNIIITACNVTVGNGGNGTLGGRVGSGLDINAFLLKNTCIQDVAIVLGNSGNGNTIGANQINSAIAVRSDLLSDLFIQKCSIVMGNGGNSTTFGGDVGGDTNLFGGVGIKCFINGQKVCVQDSVINMGNAGDGVTDEGGTVFPALYLQNVTDIDVLNCLFTTGNAGNSSADQGGSAQGVITLQSCGQARIQDCEIVGGNGGTGATPAQDGNGASGIALNACNKVQIRNTNVNKTGIGKNPGHGVFISSDSHSVEVRKCTLANTGSSTDGIVMDNGKAVEDENSMQSSIDGASVIYSNRAYNIANTQVRYNIHNTNTEGGVSIFASPTVYDNVYVP